MGKKETFCEVFEYFLASLLQGQLSWIWLEFYNLSVMYASRLSTFGDRYLSSLLTSEFWRFGTASDFSDSQSRQSFYFDWTSFSVYVNFVKL